MPRSRSKIASSSGLDPKSGKSTIKQSRLHSKNLSKAGFKAWAKSFGPEVEEVLLFADGPGDANPAWDCYARFGWRKEMPARHIAGWWQWSIRELSREISTGSMTDPNMCLKTYKAAFEAIMTAL